MYLHKLYPLSGYSKTYENSHVFHYTQVNYFNIYIYRNPQIDQIIFDFRRSVANTWCSGWKNIGLTQKSLILTVFWHLHQRQNLTPTFPSFWDLVRASANTLLYLGWKPCYVNYWEDSLYKEIPACLGR